MTTAIETKRRHQVSRTDKGGFHETESQLYFYSIVIVVKNAGDHIRRLLDSLQGLSDDVIVCDTGSTDLTVSILKAYDVRLYHIPWEGYGVSKNRAIGFARYDWILSLDADECIDSRLYERLKNLRAPKDKNTVFTMQWKNHLGGEWIKHSGWGRNWKKRLFHQDIVRWDASIAHEDVCADTNIRFCKLDGYLEHYSFRDNKEYIEKIRHSAMITAEKYRRNGRRSNHPRIIISSLYTYVKVLLFNFAFLDGPKGWLIAKVSAYYTYLKYKRLLQLNEMDRAVRPLATAV